MTINKYDVNSSDWVLYEVLMGFWKSYAFMRILSTDV